MMNMTAHSVSVLRNVSLVALATAAILAAPVARASVTAPSACPEVKLPVVEAPHLRAALARQLPAIIVAIGSSSTQSWMASDAAHSYPAVLQDALSRLLPYAHIAVINRGISGQDAAEELGRLDTDVVAIRPQLVIWQVGANGDLHAADPAVFTKLVETGIAHLHQSGEDVVLMGNQQAPRILASREHGAIEASLAQIAGQTDVSLFSRTTLMDEWARAGAPYTRFISADQLHHNDLGYRCLGEAVASAIASAVKLAPSPTASPPVVYSLTR